MTGDVGHFQPAFWVKKVPALTLLHGFYDACAMIGSFYSTAAFVGFVVVMYVAVFRKVHREAAADMPV